MTPINTKIKLPDPKHHLTDEVRLRNRYAAKAYPRKTIVYKGRNLRLYSIAWLAHLSGKSVRSLHRWDTLGKMPKPLFVLSDGVRWYSAAELKGYARLIRAANIGRMGRLPKNQEPPLEWFHRFASQFRKDLKKLLDEKLGDFPERMSDEDALVESLSRKKKFTLSPSELNQLIK